MELIKGRKTAKGVTRDEQMFRFPPTDEIWEVSCMPQPKSERQDPRNKKADPKAGLYDIAS